jgi:protein subunit release factor B
MSLRALFKPPLRRSPSSILHHALPQAHARPLSHSPALTKQFPPRRVFLDSEITESFLKGSGPGGQKINKTSSAVQLKHLPTGIVVKCQETRSRDQNRKLARKILGERIEELELGEQSRTVVKAKERSKKKASADKKKRRKYKALADGKEVEDGGDDSVDTEEITEGEEEHGGEALTMEPEQSTESAGKGG